MFIAMSSTDYNQMLMNRETRIVLVKQQHFLWNIVNVMHLSWHEEASCELS